MELEFFPMDIEYKIHNDSPVIYLYGKKSDGERVCVVDNDFEPYFYAHPLDDNEEVKEELLNLDLEDGEITKVEEESKKFMSEELDVLKVYTRLPGEVPDVKDEVTDLSSVERCFAYDIVFVNRYLIDKGVNPLCSTKVEGEWTEKDLKVDVFEAEDLSSSDDVIDDLSVLSVDIETYNPDGANVDSDEHPILMVAFYGRNEEGEDFEKVITWKEFDSSHDYIEFVDGEFELINRFKEVINDFEPDLLTGYFSDGFDLPYLDERSDKYNIDLDLGLDYSSLDVDGRSETAEISGIVHIDLLKFVRRFIGRSLDTNEYDLESVAGELLGKHKHDVDIERLADVWDDNPEDLEEYCEYNLHDARITSKLFDKMFPNLKELVKIVGFPPFSVSRMSFSKLVESYLLKQTRDYNEIIPTYPPYKVASDRRSNSYKGGFVYQPTPGLYDDVTVFDFRSLYPSIITSHNISPDTLRCSCCKETGKFEDIDDFISDDERYWFCQKKEGFLSESLKFLIKRRSQVKEKLKDEDDSLLEARSYVLKILANSFYGYLGFAHARWYSIESARSVTALGRHYIQETINEAEDKNFEVIYSDTDSIFISLNDRDKKIAKSFVDEINSDLPGMMELEYEGYYPSSLFVSVKESGQGAKKKYALLKEDGDIKIKGFEAVRRNWSPIAKELQKNVLDIILKEKNFGEAMSYTKEVINDLREKNVPLDKVTISTRLSKSVDKYDSVGPHVAVARRMKDRGVNVGSGSLISFIVTPGDGNISDRARSPDVVNSDDYDPEYYIHHQIIPSVKRIFEVLGLNTSRLDVHKSQENLNKWS